MTAIQLRPEKRCANARSTSKSLSVSSSGLQKRGNNGASTPCHLPSCLLHYVTRTSVARPSPAILMKRPMQLQSSLADTCETCGHVAGSLPREIRRALSVGELEGSMWGAQSHDLPVSTFLFHVSRIRTRGRTPS